MSVAGEALSVSLGAGAAGEGGSCLFEQHEPFFHCSSQPFSESMSIIYMLEVI